MNRLLDRAAMAPPAEPAPSGGAPPTVPPRVQAAGSSLPAPALTESASAAPYQADDHDADLQRAMAASMAEDRGSTRAAHGDMDEEEQLMRVLAESAKVQQPPTNHRDRRQHVRRDGEPVALVSGVPTYRATALALQAMFAAAPIRDAILGFPMPDDRTASLENYWAGASPSQRVERPSPPSAMVAQDAWRDVDNMDAVLPRDVLMLSSRQVDMHVLLESRRTPSHAAANAPPGTPWPLLQTYAAVASDQPKEADVPPSFADAQPTTSITLAHTDTEASVPACLWEKLAGSDGMDSLLLTEPADVLLLNVQHHTTAVPFRLDPVVFLDPFLWQKRHGHRLDGDEHARAVQELTAKLGALEADRLALLQPTGEPILPKLDAVRAYSASAESGAEVSRDLRDWVSQVHAAVQGKAERLERDLTECQQQLHDARTSLSQLREAYVQDPENQKMPYDLCAAIFQTPEKEWVACQHAGTWWRIEHSPGAQHAWDEVQRVPSEMPTDANGLVHLVYTRRETRPAAPLPDVHVALEEIARDNQCAQDHKDQARVAG